jgi:Rod binding domain-containing protein
MLNVAIHRQDRSENTPVKNITAATMISSVQQPVAAGADVGKAHDAQLKKVAHQFEAMFMAEMIRHARPSGQAVGAFAPGKSEETWRGFMDQALGQAVADSPAGAGSLKSAIEKAVRDADARANQGQVK